MPGEIKSVSFKKTASYLMKKLRKIFKPKRGPRQSGYHRLISDEEQRLGNGFVGALKKGVLVLLSF